MNNNITKINCFKVYQLYQGLDKNIKNLFIRVNMGNECTECVALEDDENIIKDPINVTKAKDGKYWKSFQEGVQQIPFFDLKIPTLMMQSIRKKQQQNVIIKPTEKTYKISFPFYGYFIGKLISQFNPNGYGVIIITPVDRQQILKIYVGDIVNATPFDKNGLCFLPNGAYYEGSIVEFQAIGEGVYIDPNASIQYIGTWVQSLPSGNGQLKTLQGRYSGNFHKGFKNGFGTYTWKNGNMYVGNFQKNLMNGKGKLAAQTCQYQGDFVKGYPHGSGKWRSNSQAYQGISVINQGQFYMGMKQGKGKFTFENGTIYEGEFTTDKPDGTGKLITSTQIIDGIWKNGINIIVISKNKRTNE